ncbi:MAG: DPP IV N-terminal domain-containing protein [Gammaproteobacteria bacterium]|nr:DPP IV N-terminal domain-containing protein [Gammaproteobacteria bacterium]
MPIPHHAELANGFLINDWHIQPRNNRVARNGESVRLEPRVMDVLVMLAMNKGETVTRTELMDTVWAGSMVTEDALNQSVSKLRKVFGGAEDGTNVIETVPKIGYRLTADVALDSALPHNSPDNAPTAALQNYFPYFAGLLLLGAGVIWFFNGKSPDTVSRADPMRLVPFTSFTGHEFSPAFSPDGTRVAFSWRPADTSDADLYIKQVNSETPLRITDHDADEISPAWSPDGTTVAFLRRDETTCAIYTVPAIGGPERKLIDCTPGSYTELSWSPDGNTLAYRDRVSVNHPYIIYLLNLADNERRALTNPDNSITGDAELRFSPDGEYIAFTRITAVGVEDLHIVPSSGGEPERLTFDNLKMHGVGWSADGEDIIYSSNRGGTFSLWTISRRGGEPRWLGVTGKHIDGFSLSGDGRRLVYERDQSVCNLWQVQLTAGGSGVASPLPSSTQWEWSPQFSPDGNRIAFVSDRSGTAEIWVSNRDGFNPLQLTEFKGPFTHGPRWSPDGVQLVFATPLNGNYDIYTIAADGGTPLRITSHPTEDRVGNWSADGQHIYFASKRSGSWQIWKTTPAGDEPQQVTFDGGFTSMESRDGRWLYFSKQEIPGIWRKPVSGGDEELVLQSLAPVDWNNWLVTENGIFYIDRALNEEATLAFFDFDTRRVREITQIEKLLFRSGISLTPDGQWLLFSRLDFEETDLMLVENYR